MHVDPIKPVLKPPGTQHLRLNYDGLLPSFAFKLNLRRYNQVKIRQWNIQGLPKVGRCRLTLSDPR